MAFCAQEPRLPINIGYRSMADRLRCTGSRSAAKTHRCSSGSVRGSSPRRRYRWHSALPAICTSRPWKHPSPRRSPPRWHALPSRPWPSSGMRCRLPCAHAAQAPACTKRRQ